MTQEGAVPLGYNDALRRIVREELAAFMYSGSSRNMSIGEGGRLTVKGGQLRVLYPEDEGGGAGVYFGQIVNATTGAYQGTGLLVLAPDGTNLLLVRTDEATGQARVDMYDSGGRVIAGNDAVSGQGLARPYVPASFHRARWADFTVQTTSSSFETLWSAELYKQHPRLVVGARASMDTAGTAGEVRVLVNGVQLGDVFAPGFAIAPYTFGPAAVAGAHMAKLTVEVQGRRTSASGALRVEPIYCYGLQS